MGKIEKFTNSLRNQTGKEVKGMKKVLISLGLAMVLVVAMTAPVMAAEQKAATVSVPSYISFTVTDTAPAGLQFGTMSPGDTDKREADNDVRAVQLTVGAETNSAVNIQTRGEDFAITLVRGTATGGSATTLEDSGGGFSGTVNVDDIVINETDGSTATVTEVTSDTTLTFIGGLSGGINDTVTATDAYSVKAASSVSTIPIGNAHWDTDSTTTDYDPMTSGYVTVAGPSSPGSPLSQDLWHWLSVPNGQAPGDYTAIFYYQAA